MPCEDAMAERKVYVPEKSLLCLLSINGGFIYIFASACNDYLSFDTAGKVCNDIELLTSTNW